MSKNVPNIITIIRFLLIPFLIFFIVRDNYIAASIVFLLSGLTDVLDGFIARKFNLISDFGKLMDPLADKLTQISTLIAIVIKSIIPAWILIVIVIKEVAMIAGASFLYGKQQVVSSKWYGKLSTVTLYIAIFISMLIRQFDLPEIYTQCNNYIYYFALICTLFSLIMYFKKFCFKDLLKDKENKEIS